MKYQNYSHYKLPITTNPLEYGKLIEQFDNKYIIHLNTFNILIINEINNENFIKFFRKGEFLFEFKDIKISLNTFSRFIQDYKFTFKNGKLISTKIISVNGYRFIYPFYEDTNSIQLKQNFNPLLILLLISLF
jgi:hypothetical protein